MHGSCFYLMYICFVLDCKVLVVNSVREGAMEVLRSVTFISSIVLLVGPGQRSLGQV